MREKISALVLALAMLATSIICSCGETPEDSSSDSSSEIATEEVTETEERAYPEIPEDTNYDGYNFRIVGYRGGYTETDDYVAEEAVGEVITDAVYERNLKVSEMLNVKFSAEINDDVLSFISRSVSAGDDAYDLAFTRGNQLASSVQGGYYVNLLEDAELSLDMPWYDENSISSLTMRDALYSVNCDISTQHNNETSIIYYNKTFAENLNIDDLYQTAFEGRWTIDLLQQYAKIAADDTNGDGAMTADDTFGITGNNGMSYIFYVGEGGRYMEYEDDEIVVKFGEESNINRMIDVITRFSDPEYVLDEHVTSYNASSYATFCSARSLFFVYALGSVHIMRNTDVEYGLLPVPKETEEQENYYNDVNFSGNAFMGIPLTVSDIERTSIITDVLAAESYYTLRPAYYEIAIKTKYIRDEASVQMLDLIFANRVYDIGVVYDIGGLVGTMCSLFVEGSTNVQSTYARIEKQVKRAADKFIKAMENGNG